MSWTLVRTIKAGTKLANANGFKKAIESVGMNVGSNAYCIMSAPEFSVCSVETQILKVKSLEELGFNEGARIDQIREVVEKLGLTKCIPDTGPQLRIQYTNQPKDEWLVIFMDSIMDPNGDPRIFQVGHNDRGKWLVADFGHSHYVWKKHRKFVFTVSL